jgi:hypothetical protein
MIRRSFILIVLSLLPMTTISAAPTTRPVEQIRRVLIISIDGLRPDLLLRAETPNVRKLLNEGSYTFWARTCPASTTLPAHVSMLTGVTPEVHAIMWNADLPLSRPVYPAAPTLFQVAKRAGYKTAIAAGKSKFEILAKPGTIDYAFITSAEKCESPEVAAHALAILRDHQPDVMFVHLPSVDNVGHAKGWGSPEQIKAIEQADDLVGQIVATLDELKLSDQTLLIVTSDHGGAGRTHGPDDPRSRTIPWIARGPGVRRGFDLTRLPDLDVETYDTFATACTVIGIPIERHINGKFVSQIMESRELVMPGPPPPMTPATAPTAAAPTTQASR